MTTSSGGTAWLWPPTSNGAHRTARVLRVVRHDLRTEPLSSLDVKNPPLVHARCVLAHLGNREALFDALADLLSPGGHLVIEEWGAAGAGYILHSPYKRTQMLWERYQQALMAHLHVNGNDGTWPPRVHTRMVRAGLTVQTFASSRSWKGGTAGCKLPIALSRQIEDQLVEQGMDRDDLGELRTHLADPDVALFPTAPTPSSATSRPRRAEAC